MQIFVVIFSSACEALCQCLPDQLKDDTFAACLKEDKSTKHWLTMLRKNLDTMGQQQGSGAAAGNSSAAGSNAPGAPAGIMTLAGGKQGASLVGGPKLPGGI